MNTHTSPFAGASAFDPSAVQVPQAKNSELGQLIRPNYSLAELEAVRKALVEHKTLRLRRYSSGGHSAVTVVEQDDKTLEAAIDGLLVFHWDRDNIMQTLAEPCQAGGQELSISCSVGLAVHPEDGRDFDTLMRNADTAMYRAKALGR
ncbi:MAG TPA: diguanylate cyclase, partial [Candidatus Obscuribacter sp.]|nr:diguanylate cyclase [Candidatus Obscuribacter sp.]